jgi:hypothetical protein
VPMGSATKPGGRQHPLPDTEICGVEISWGAPDDTGQRYAMLAHRPSVRLIFGMLAGRWHPCCPFALRLRHVPLAARSLCYHAGRAPWKERDGGPGARRHPLSACLPVRALPRGSCRLCEFFSRLRRGFFRLTCRSFVPRPAVHGRRQRRGVATAPAAAFRRVSRAGR